MYFIEGPPQSDSKFFPNITFIGLHKASNVFIADLALYQHSFDVTGITVLQCEYPMQS